MGGLTKKPKAPKPEPAPLMPDLLSLDKAKRRRAAKYGQGGTIMSDALGG